MSTATAERRGYLKALDGLFMPARVKALPIDPRGYPVPWFVMHYDDGTFDFRMIGPNKVRDAYRKRLCWICGQRLGVHLAFVIGPMCSINRITAEPPSHLDCARFAAQACPFLVNPAMRRNEKDLHPDRIDPPGLHSPLNPGAMIVWVTGGYSPEPGGIFTLDAPTLVEWYTRGRLATRAEAEHAFNLGLDRLYIAAGEEPANRQAEGYALLDRQAAIARQLLPREGPS